MSHPFTRAVWFLGAAAVLVAWLVGLLLGRLSAGGHVISGIAVAVFLGHYVALVRGDRRLRRDVEETCRAMGLDDVEHVVDAVAEIVRSGRADVPLSALVHRTRRTG